VSGPGKGDKRGYSWPPVEPGQAGAAHPSTTHGAWSPALRDPVAAAIYERTMAWVPEALRDDPLIVAQARGCSQVEAMAQLIYEHMLSQGLAAAIDDVTVTEATETELHTEGRTARKARSQARRTVALAEQFRRYEGQASRERESLRRMVLERAAEAPKQDVMQLMAERIRELDQEDAGGR
jgi:hypothetical protein